MKVTRDPSPVGETAIGAAMMRARENSRSTPLFNDPLASAFVEAAPPIFADEPNAEDDPEIAHLEAAFEEAVILRTRFFDDLVLAAVSSGCRQVVLTGAGLDSRAFRLGMPHDVCVYELDKPEVLDFKEQVIQHTKTRPECQRVVVPLDLASPTWPHKLLEAGFEVSALSIWILEGVVPYLSSEETERLFAAITRLSAIGSRLSFDHDSGSPDDPMTRARDLPSMSDIVAMWKGGLIGDAKGLLDRFGWSSEVIDGGDLQRRYQRDQHSDLVGVIVSAIRSSN